MPVQIYFCPIIQPGAFQSAVVHPKSGRADDVQIGKSRRAEARDVSGIRRYFRFDKANVKHKIRWELRSEN
jgi:hypothetical protein